MTKYAPVEAGKLTKVQVQVLRMLARKTFGMTVYIAGRPTCGALRRRGLIESSDGDRPFNRFDGNPIVKITEAGRAALLSQDKSND